MRGTFIGLCCALLFASCGADSRKAAVIWTDRPEFVAYVEQFNAANPRYKVEVFYKAAPGQALAGTDEIPDIVVGSWLKNAATRAFFTPLDFFFEDLLLAENSFYPSLLNLGNIEGKQYLLPVSFNIPAFIFSRENAALVEQAFTLSPDDVRELGKAYNERKGEYFTRMGFSPRWDDDFLFVFATLYGAAFKEGAQLSWDNAALEKAISQVRDWTREANASAAAEDDFAFKYLYDPAPKLAASGRVLFAYMPSDKLFTVPEQMRATIDFRWVARNSSIPVNEGSTYLGICKKGKAKNAANAFVQWFYKDETQRKLLDSSKSYRTMESVFGISGGFSAVKSVNEQVYPAYYPGLLGHVPPAEYVSAPNILPKDWTTLKRRVVLPYLHDRTGVSADASKGLTLEERLADWYRQNPRK